MLSLFAANNSSNKQEEMTLSTPEYHRETEIKLILLGETGVGKTSLALRFASDEFRPYAEATIGVSFTEPTMIYEHDDDEETKKKIRTKVLFKIWDTAGQEKYHALASMYYRGAAAAIVVFDISRPSSFVTLRKWIDELKVKGPPDIVIVICGNKLDLEASGDRQVSHEQAKMYAQDVGAAAYIETSAKDSTNVQQMFEQVAKKVPYKPNTANRNAGTAAQGAALGGTPIQLGAKPPTFRHRIQNCCRS